MKSPRAVLKTIEKSPLIQTINTARWYWGSYYGSRLDHALFEDVKAYCVFVGHNRSGSSLIAGLLDAHPDVIFSDEMDALRFVSAGFSRNQIYHLLLESSRKLAEQGRKKAGRNGQTYSYYVPGQWNGRFRTIQVIGDKKASRSTRRFARDGSLLDKLRRTMGDVPVKIIHSARNPYDNISTTMLRSGWSFERAIEHYRGNCSTIRDLWQRVGASEMLLVKNDQLIARPQQVLDGICGFLGIKADADYLDACASIVFKSPSKSRHSVPWTPELIERVRRQIVDEFDFLAGYSYDE